MPYTSLKENLTSIFTIWEVTAKNHSLTFGYGDGMHQGVEPLIRVDQGNDDAQFGEPQPYADVFGSIFQKQSDNVALFVTVTFENICYFIAVFFEFGKIPLLILEK